MGNPIAGVKQQDRVATRGEGRGKAVRFPTVLLSERYLRTLVIVASAAIFLVLLVLPTPEGLRVEGQRAIAVFVLCVLLWATHVVPLAITSLLAIVLLPLLGILDTREAYSLFGNEAVFFILGAFVLAAAVMHTGLSTRLSLTILDRFGRTPGRLLLWAFLLPALLSFWMSEHAVAALMLPIFLEIAHGLRLTPKGSRYGIALFLSLAWGCVIGGIATPLGGARVPLALGMLREFDERATISFVAWMKLTLPAVVILLFLGWVFMKRLYPVDIGDVEGAKERIREKLETLGPLSREAIGTGILMVATILAWIFFGHRVGLASIAIVAVVLLFFFRLVRWNVVEEYVNWGIILMYGGAIALGSALHLSGAALWAAKAALEGLSVSPFGAIMLLSGTAIGLTHAMSNSAVIATLVPLGLEIGPEIGLAPSLMTAAVAIPSGLAFALPISTPAVAIAYSSGFVRLRTLVVSGAVMGIVSWVVFCAMAYFYWPLVGFGSF